MRQLDYTTIGIAEQRSITGGVFVLAAGFFVLGLASGWVVGRKLFKRRDKPRRL